ncbi:hypothetical protein DN051_32350 [Streptomyces cadmiisoli]|uniref:Phage tail tape measure protein domain-containing protein n=2 Tax=Streptomyces cadmiisoli TaxID=2184053 RepID=A0A2Z4J6N6_9ACTN|nr:hypothetical protein DN051_32350 [Streptomyces cadmiisoli]
MTRDISGRLRDAQGRFAAAGAETGEAGGAAIETGTQGRLAGLGAVLAGIAAAAGALFVGALTEAMEQERIVDKLQAQLGTTEEAAKEAGESAGHLYANAVSDTFEEAANAIKSTMQSGILPPDASQEQLEEIATKAQDVAKVFDQDLGGVTNAVAQLMRTGLAKDADEAFDVITRGFQTGANKADDFLDTINEYSTQFRNMGIDAKTATGILSQGLQAGARDADVVADTIKEFSIGAVAGADSIRAGYDRLGIDADKMFKAFGKGGKESAKAFDDTLDALRNVEDPVKRNSIAIDLFGTKAEDMGEALYALDPSKAVGTLGTVGGAAKTMGDTIRDNATTRVNQFKRKLEETFVHAIGNYVIPGITRFVNYVNSNLGPAVRSSTRQIGDMFSKAKSGQGSFAPLASGARNAMSGVKGALGGAVNVVRTQFLPWFKDQLPKIKPVVQQVARTFGAAMQTIGDIIKRVTAIAKFMWERFGGVLKSIIKGAVDAVLAIIKGLFRTVEGIFQVFSGILTGDWRKIWEGLKNIVGGLKDAIVGAAKGVFSGVTNAAKALISGMASIGKDIVYGLVNGITSLGGYVASAVKNFVTQHIPNKIKDVLGIASPSKVTKELGKWVGQGLIVGMTGTAAKVASTAKKLSESIAKAIKGSTGKTKTALRKLSDLVAKDNKRLLSFAKQRDKIMGQIKKAEEKLKDLRSSKKDYAASIRDNIIGSSGFLSNDDGSVVSAGSILQKLKDAAVKARIFAENLAKLKAKGISSALIDQIAQQGVEGGAEAAAALASSTPAQVAAINDQQKALASAATKAGSTASKAMYDSGIAAAEGLIKGLKKKKRTIEKVMLDIAKSMVGAIKKALGIKSPSRVMAQIANWTADGLTRQLERRIVDVEKIAEKLGNAIAERAWKAARDMATEVKNFQHATQVANQTGSDAAYVTRKEAIRPSVINVHVAGHVTTERDLAKVIAGNVRDEIIRIGKRNGGRNGL